MTFHEGFGCDTESDRVIRDDVRSRDVPDDMFDSVVQGDVYLVRDYRPAKPRQSVRLCHDCQSTPVEPGAIRCQMCGARHLRRRAG